MATGHPRTTGTYSKVLGSLRARGRIAHADGRDSKDDAHACGTSAGASAGDEDQRAAAASAPTPTLSCSTPRELSIESTYREPSRPPIGIDHVVVNGVPVVSEGKAVVEGVTPGRAVRAPGPVKKPGFLKIFEETRFS